MNGRFVWAIVCTAACLVCCSGAAHAQTAQSQPSSVTTIDYVDPSFGFELRLPAGWEYDRTRFQQFKDSIGLLRGHAPGGRRALQITVFRSFDMKPFEDWVVGFGKAAADLTNSPRVDWETWSLPPRAGAILTFSSKLGAGLTRSHYLCVPFDPSTVWVLVYGGTAYSEPEQRQIRSEFDQIIGSLRIQYDPKQAERLAPALERGKALIEKLRERASQVRLDEQEHFYELILAGKPIGFFKRRISREEYVFSGRKARHRYAKEGLRVRERSWRFGDDGAVQHVRLDLFSSFEMRSELIERQETLIPPAEAADGGVLIRTEQAIREDDVLVSSFTTSRDTSLPEPAKPISVGPVYLDQSWLRLLPGLLWGGPAELYAVAVYDSEIRAMISHTIKPAGRRTVAGFTQPVYAFEVREGFVGDPSLLLCDERGSLVRLEAGDLVATRISASEAEQKYGQRCNEARRRSGLKLD